MPATLVGFWRRRAGECWSASVALFLIEVEERDAPFAQRLDLLGGGRNIARPPGGDVAVFDDGESFEELAWAAGVRATPDGIAVGQLGT